MKIIVVKHEYGYGARLEGCPLKGCGLTAEEAVKSLMDLICVDFVQMVQKYQLEYLHNVGKEDKKNGLLNLIKNYDSGLSLEMPKQ